MNENTDVEKTEDKELNWQFCPRCGFKLPTVKGVKFCIKCGLDISYIKEHKSLPPSVPIPTVSTAPTPTYIYPSPYYRVKLKDTEIFETKERKLWSAAISILLPIIAFVIMNFAAVGIIIAIMLFVWDLAFLTSLISSPLFLILTSLVEVILIIFPVLYVGKYLERPTLKNRLTLLGFTSSKFDRIDIFKELLIGIGAAVVGLFLVGFVSVFMEFVVEFFFNVSIVSDGPSSDIDIYISSANTVEMILLILIMILVVGTSEEILFRGFLQKGLVRNLGNTAGIFLTAIIFASIHLVGIFLSYFLGAINLAVMLVSLFLFFFPYLAISLLLGYIYYLRNENLISVILTHGLYNSLTIVIAVIFFSSLELTVIFFGVLIFMGVFPFVLYYFLDKYNVKKPLEISA